VGGVIPREAAVEGVIPRGDTSEAVESAIPRGCDSAELAQMLARTRRRCEGLEARLDAEGAVLLAAFRRKEASLLSRTLPPPLRYLAFTRYCFTRVDGDMLTPTGYPPPPTQ